MATNLSTYLSDKLLDHAFKHTAYTSTVTYLGLYTTMPTMPGGAGGTEVTGGSYVRQELDTTLGSAAGEQSSNASAITFPQATADWGTVVALGIFDASSGGNLLAASLLTPSKSVTAGDTLSFAIGDLVITLN